MAYEWQRGLDLGGTVRLLLKLIGPEGETAIIRNGGYIMCIL
jgi:hypothetical protein